MDDEFDDTSGQVVPQIHGDPTKNSHDSGRGFQAQSELELLQRGPGGIDNRHPTGRCHVIGSLTHCQMRTTVDWIVISESYLEVVGGINQPVVACGNVVRIEVTERCRYCPTQMGGQSTDAVSDQGGALPPAVADHRVLDRSQASFGCTKEHVMDIVLHSSKLTVGAADSSRFGPNRRFV